MGRRIPGIPRGWRSETVEAGERSTPGRLVAGSAPGTSRRRVLLGGGAAVATLLAAACQSGAGAGGGSPLGPLTKEAITLRLMQRAAPEEQFAHKYAETFSQQHPNVKVAFEETPTPDYWTKV